MVNNQPYFKDTFVQFQKWLEETECWNSGNKSIFVTCGDWDLQVMLPKQCRLSSMDVPSEMKHWINIKKVGFEVLTVVGVKISVFWVATLCSSEEACGFGGIYCLHRYGRSVSLARNHQKQAAGPALKCRVLSELHSVNQKNVVFIKKVILNYEFSEYYSADGFFYRCHV
jgi:hypothetical protein